MYLFLINKLLFVLFFMSGAPLQSQVLMTVSGIPNTKGQLLIAVYNDQSTFNQSEKAVFRKAYAVTSSTMKIDLSHLPKGNYAIAICHDANKNGKMDKNFLGIPSEAFGFSNNPTVRFSAPTYKECVIDIPNNFTINIGYLVG